MLLASKFDAFNSQDMISIADTAAEHYEQSTEMQKAFFSLQMLDHTIWAICYLAFVIKICFVFRKTNISGYHRIQFGNCIVLSYIWMVAKLLVLYVNDFGGQICLCNFDVLGNSGKAVTWLWLWNPRLTSWLSVCQIMMIMSFAAKYW